MANCTCDGNDQLLRDALGAISSLKSQVARLQESNKLFKAAAYQAIAERDAIAKGRSTAVKKSASEHFGDAVADALKNPTSLSPIKSWTIGDGVSDDHAR
jgi:hypothetical protein